jgi:hypothetical protein
LGGGVLTRKKNDLDGLKLFKKKTGGEGGGGLGLGGRIKAGTQEPLKSASGAAEMAETQEERRRRT